MAEQRCPLCGKRNPETQETCLFCGARLKPLVSPVSPEQVNAPIPKDMSNSGEGNKPPESSLPDWLQSLRNGGSESTPGSENTEKPHFGSSLEMLAKRKTVEPEVTKKEDVPDWLFGLRSMASPGGKEDQLNNGGIPGAQRKPADMVEPGSVSKQTPKVEGKSTPDWLSRLEEQPKTDSSAKGKPKESHPEWLEDLKSREIHHDDSPANEPEEIPDWLEQLPSIELTETGDGIYGEYFGNGRNGNGQATDSHEMVDWVAKLQSATEATGGREGQIDSTEPTTTSEKINALEQTSVPAEESMETLKAEGEETTKSESIILGGEVETPDWLSTLSAVKTSVEPDAPQAPQEKMEKAELPAWVQALRPLETILPESEVPGEEETVETETMGPLAGLAGVLPFVARQGSLHKSPGSQNKLQISSNQQKYAAQLEKMVQDEGQTRIQKLQGVNPSKILRLFLAFVLVGAVLLPILTGSAYTPDLDLFPSEWGLTNQTIQAIPTGATLLVAFDYDPALAGELEAAGAAVIDHLLTRDVHLVMISTTPLGPALGERLLDGIQAVHPDEDPAYTNLGYLAGGPSGIHLLASNPRGAVELTTEGKNAWEIPALAGISQLADFKAVLILTDNADTGRLWIEQTKKAIGSTPILMVISAQAEPLIRPYLDSGQIQGLISGLSGGKAYEQTYGTPGLARRSWDAFGSGMVTVVLVIAIGSTWNAIRSWRVQKKAGKES